MDWVPFDPTIERNLSWIRTIINWITTCRHSIYSLQPIDGTASKRLNEMIDRLIEECLNLSPSSAYYAAPLSLSLTLSLSLSLWFLNYVRTHAYRLGIRLEFMGTVVVTLAAAFAVIERNTIDPGT